MLAVPFLLPGLEAEASVILTACNEEVAISDGVVDGQTSRSSNSIGVGGQLSALEEEGARIPVLLELGLAEGDDAGLHLLEIYFLAQSDSLESWYTASTNNNIAGLLSVNTALISNEITHGLESLAISSQHNDSFLRAVGAGDGGELGQGRHEDGLVSVLAGEGLEPHHESAVTCDATHVHLLVKIFDSRDELLLHRLSQLTCLAHAEG